MTLDEKIAASEEQVKHANEQVAAWGSTRDAAMGRLATLREFKAEQAAPPREE